MKKLTTLFLLALLSLTASSQTLIDGEVGMPDVMFIVNYILNGKFPDEK